LDVIGSPFPASGRDLTLLAIPLLDNTVSQEADGVDRDTDGVSGRHPERRPG
jgi:hypothetical protein